jgi:hypothetical protein
MASATERARRAAASLSLALAVALAAPAAGADPSPADKARATQLMDDGFDHREKGDEQSALKAFGAADTIMNVPTTAIEVARSQAALKMLVEAQATAIRVTKMPLRAKEPAPFVQARKDAEALLVELAARVPTLQVEIAGVKESDSPEVRIDNDAVPAEELRAPRKLNPGPHRVVVRLAGEEKSESVTLAERDSKTVTVDMSGIGPAPKKDDDGKPSVAPKVLLYGGFGLGVAGIGVGTITGIMSFSAVSSAKQSCVGNQCTASSAGPDIDRAKTLGNVATVAFVVGGAGLAAGVVGLLLDKDPPPAKGSGGTTSWGVGPGSLFVSRSF